MLNKFSTSSTASSLHLLTISTLQVKLLFQHIQVTLALCIQSYFLFFSFALSDTFSESFFHRFKQLYILEVYFFIALYLFTCLFIICLRKISRFVFSGLLTLFSAFSNCVFFYSSFFLCFFIAFTVGEHSSNEIGSLLYDSQNVSIEESDSIFVVGMLVLVQPLRIPYVFVTTKFLISSIFMAFLQELKPFFASSFSISSLLYGRS